MAHGFQPCLTLEGTTGGPVLWRCGNENPGLRRKLRLRLLQHHGQAALHGAHTRRQLLQPREHLRWATGGSNWKRPLGNGNKGSSILGKNSKTSWKVAVERAFFFDFGFNLELG